MGPTWQFLDGRLSLVYKADSDCVYELGLSAGPPFMDDRDRALCIALLRLALKQLEAE